MRTTSTDVLIIGAGPAGAVAAALLLQLGHRVLVLERQRFPRFVIGESLLPQCMDILAQAGLLPAVAARGYQRKNGAQFAYRQRRANIDFGAQFTPGYSYTYQVPRGDFDQTLISGAQAMGAEVRFEETVMQVTLEHPEALIEVATASGEHYQVRARFILDASGYGRVLPSLLDLDRPSTLAPRASAFTHVRGDLRDGTYDTEKILIAVHPEQRDIWYWLIPFSHGHASIGVIAQLEALAGGPDELPRLFEGLLRAEPSMDYRLPSLDFVMPPRSLVGYSRSVKQLYGPQFALLGNAGEFLDPVFSSGVTVALKSAQLAVAALDRQLRGQEVNWQTAFADPLMAGVTVFGHFVRRWYDGSLQSIIFFENKPPEVYRMICSCLAGYVWDASNPYCKQTDRRLGALATICAQQPF